MTRTQPKLDVKREKTEGLLPMPRAFWVLTSQAH